MVARNCAHCGEPFVGQRTTAKYCSKRCRVGASRARKRSDNPDLAPITPLPMPVTPSAEPAEPHPLVAATERTLREAGVLDTVDGQRAMLLAERMANPREAGTAVATLSTRLHEAVEAALSSVTRVDRMDEVTKRRDEKLRQARGA